MELTTQPHTNLAQLEYGSFKAFIDSFIKKIEIGKILTEKGQRYSESTIRGYIMLKDEYANFVLFQEAEWKEKSKNCEIKEEPRNFDVNISEITFSFAQAFHQFLVTETDLSKNSIGTVLAKFKAVMNHGFKTGVAYWNGSGLKVPREKSVQTYLSTNELKNLRIAEKLTKSEKRVLDIHIIHSFTGMRYETLRKFLHNPSAYIKEFNGKPYIEITEDKTDYTSTIPFGDTVREILIKYDWKMKVPTGQYMNRKIKTIAEKADMTSLIIERKTVKGVMQENILPKFKKLSTHTARRTLISQMSEAGFQKTEIMPVSGHTNEKQMNDYVKIENVIKIKGILGNEFFNKII